MTPIIEQMKFCNELSRKLTEAVVLHENRRCTKDRARHTDLHDYGNGIKEAGATKTQIQAGVVQLRRELNMLSRMLND
jgi:hypothetical protein